LVLRTVLEKWDFQDPEGWRLLLPQAIDDSSNPPGARPAVHDLEVMLARFAQSETFGQLAAARSCLRDVEYVVPLTDEGAPAAEDLPLVRGVIDCLWEDEKGNRHLLAFAPKRDKEGQDRPIELVFAALAVQRQFGVWPKTVTRYFFEDGQSVRRSGNRLRHRDLLAEVRSALLPFSRSPGASA
jgi:hypothetical protein